MSVEIQGLCEVCQQVKSVRYCEVCKAWICASCRINIPARMRAAILKRL